MTKRPAKQHRQPWGVTIMKLCDNMDDFRKKFDRVFKKTPIQSTFDDINWTASAA
jgi:hypothetical protein